MAKRKLTRAQEVGNLYRRYKWTEHPKDMTFEIWLLTL